MDIGHGAVFTEDVAEMLSDAVVRDWFADARGPVRRMHISHHPEDGLVVLSLWEGDRCRATFRLPVGDATRLAHDLVDVVASQAPVPAGRLDVAPVVQLRDPRP